MCNTVTEDYHRTPSATLYAVMALDAYMSNYIHDIAHSHWLYSSYSISSDIPESVSHVQ